MTILEQLQSKIDAANEAYWKQSKSIISDQEYDQLIEKLRKLNPHDKRLEYVGQEDNTGRVKVRHAEHMYSIAKIYSYGDLVAWCKKVARSPSEMFSVSCKYDGLSVEYCRGKFITRGDGDVGTDITHLRQFINVRTNFVDKARMSDYLFDGEPHPRFVGELLVPTYHFGYLKAHFPELFGEYKTPRNLASGFANFKSTEPLAPLVDKGEYLVATTPVCELVNHRAYEMDITLTDIVERRVDFINELRDYKGMPCDGIVVRLTDEEYGKTLGVTAHHRNDYIALKFKEEEADVPIKDIIWQVGERHVTPVATFDPVELDGVRVSNVTLHNPDFIEKNCIDRNSVLTIIRQGGVIPKVIRVGRMTTGSRVSSPFAMPDLCPCCKSKLVREGAYLSCTNPACVARVSSKIDRGLKILGYKGVGPYLATEVTKDLYLRDIIDWFEEANDYEVLKAKAYNANDIQIVLNSIDLTLKRPVLPSTLLRAMCIEDVGQMFTDLVVSNVEGGIRGLVETVPADEADKKLIEAGVRSDGRTAFMIWFENNKERFLEFMNLFTLLPEAKPVVSANAETYCFTGTGPKPRKDLEAAAVSKGNRVTDNANLCTVLVCADPNGNSGKLKKARAKGIRIISYDKFVDDVCN